MSSNLPGSPSDAGTTNEAATGHSFVAPRPSSLVAQEFGPAPAIGILAFCLLAVMNTGGYRYGASDQAFYVPAVNARMDASLFPRDRSLLEAESRLMVFDDALAWVAKTTGVGLPAIFLSTFLLGLVGLGVAIALTGSAIYASGWTTTALLLVLTLRHRIPRTGVNTLEGYLHPRMLAFAAGVFAVAALLRRRPWAALASVAAAGVIHPTTAVWFGILIGVAIIVDVPRLRSMMVGAAAIAGLAALWMLTLGPLRERLVIMDPVWMAAVESKDYLFPAGWPLIDWILNLGYVAAIVSLYRLRVRAGATDTGERGLVAGCLVLFTIFAVSVPLTMARVALAVQLQVSRIFWMLDFVGTVLLVWAAAEAFRVKRRRVLVVAAVVAAASLGRGLYVMGVEHPERSLVQVDVPVDAWTDAMHAVRRLPVSTHVLADPGHAWKYGTSVRVAALRDVYQEDVKDAAIAMYSRAVAERVVSRARDVRDFATLTAVEARTLASKYALDVLVIDREMALPEIYRNDRFRVYRLR